MYLNLKDARVRTNLYKFCKRSSQKALEEHGIKKCPSCYGTGLKGVAESGDTTEYSWDTSSYCDNCDGIGYLGIDIKSSNKLTDQFFIHSGCKGQGCFKCDFSGIVDWVSNIMGN